MPSDLKLVLSKLVHSFVIILNSHKEMIFKIPMKPIISGMVIGGSVHGLSDFYNPPQQLFPYLILCFQKIIPRKLSTVLFASSAVYHFGLDIGYINSLTFNVTTALLALYNIQLSSLVMAVYYLLIHIPLNIIFCWKNGLYGFSLFVIMMYFIGAIYGHVKNIDEIELTEFYQLLITCHTLSHFIK
jgi:hypothetical protein